MAARWAAASRHRSNRHHHRHRHSFGGDGLADKDSAPRPGQRHRSDVEHAAGVSAMTVSRVGTGGITVREQTCDTVRAAIESLLNDRAPHASMQTTARYAHLSE
ncbi:MAG: LacI family DNA-binding transcriptional regulator, partial [Lysobacteraceae bacterium]